MRNILRLTVFLLVTLGSGFAPLEVFAGSIRGRVFEKDTDVLLIDETITIQAFGSNGVLIATVQSDPGNGNFHIMVTNSGSEADKLVQLSFTRTVIVGGVPTQIVVTKINGLNRNVKRTQDIDVVVGTTAAP